MPERDEHYWYGSLATTVAMAATSPDPRMAQGIVLSAWREFVRAHPKGDPLGDHIRQLVGKERA